MSLAVLSLMESMKVKFHISLSAKTGSFGGTVWPSGLYPTPSALPKDLGGVVKQLILSPIILLLELPSARLPFLYRRFFYVLTSLQDKEYDARNDYALEWFS